MWSGRVTRRLYQPLAITDLSLPHDSRLTTRDLRFAIPLRGGQRVQDGVEDGQRPVRNALDRENAKQGFSR